jgi:peptidoglycan/xylan/chitin deacetylase (PgdA/CDA1 family)
VEFPAALVLSLDFELAWGLRERAGDADCAKGMERVHEIVPRLLDIFSRYDISATWATVGHLMLRDDYGGWDRLKPFSPSYPWFAGQWYEGVPAFDAAQSKAYFAPDLVRRIVACPVYQELACHTFSHVYVESPGCGRELLREELRAWKEVAREYGRPLKSIVFPRNLVGHLDVVEDAGIRSYRGLDSEWYWFGLPGHLRSVAHASLPLKPIPLAMRLGRWLDDKARLTPPSLPVRAVGGLWELPHSMFFSGLSGSSRLVSMKDRWRRATRGLDRAVEQGRLMSIYTHPHNFRNATEDLLSTYERICRHAADLRDAGKLRILTMDRVAEELDNGWNMHWTR